MILIVNPFTFSHIKTDFTPTIVLRSKTLSSPRPNFSWPFHFLGKEWWESWSWIKLGGRENQWRLRVQLHRIDSTTPNNFKDTWRWRGIYWQLNWNKKRKKEQFVFNGRNCLVWLDELNIQMGINESRLDSDLGQFFLIDLKES